MLRGSYIPNIHSLINNAEINLSKYTSLGRRCHDINKQKQKKPLGCGVVTNFDLCSILHARQSAIL